MKKINISILIAIFAIASCTPYLDVVPDSTRTIEDIFSIKEEAWNALAKVYSYIPSDYTPDNSGWLLGDEYVGRLDYDVDETRLRACRIMRGLQSVSNPRLSDWTGNGGGKKLYEGIRQCNIFIENIDKVRDMDASEKTIWKAQALFLKGYYNFLLIRKYGPIVIVDKSVAPNAETKDLFVYREKVEDCFDYALRLMDQAIPDLKDLVIGSDLGQIDKIGALAIKARVLLFRASPFFNGNADYYSDFLDYDKRPFFPLEYNREKWKDVIDACDTVLKRCAGVKDLFTYERELFYGDDKANLLVNEAAIRKLYDLRMLVVTPWNKELLWGFSNINIGAEGMPHATQIRLPTGPWAIESGGDQNSASWSWQWLGANYTVAERYYTRNGLPLDEDLSFDRNRMYDAVTLPARDNSEYDQYSGFLQPGVKTISLYMNREPRFYANLGFTGGYWRGHRVCIPTMMYANGLAGKGTPTTDFFVTGIGIQKLAHPESTSGTANRQTRYPFPTIRLADIYLMKAEALNEYSGPSQEVYDLLNKVRTRAGIPAVEYAWGAEYGLARTPDKHKDQKGLREIILQERGIEFAFEGHRFWDMLRTKRAPAEFSAPVWGWNADTGTTFDDFFVLSVKQQRKFTITDCLWPIDLAEMNTNSNLIQNPGWK